MINYILLIYILKAYIYAYYYNNENIMIDSVRIGRSVPIGYNGKLKITTIDYKNDYLL